MKRYKMIDVKGFLQNFCFKHLPNKNDNLQQIVIKAVYLAVILVLIFSICFFGIYYGDVAKQQSIIDTERQIFEENNYGTAYKLLKERNPHYEGWLSIPNTKLNNPVFKGTDNSFYLNCNSLGKSSKYGSLFFDCRIEATKQNRVIYGNNAEDGMMFSVLAKLRNINFYKENYMLTLSDREAEYRYKIYSVFVLDGAPKSGDMDNYDIYRNDFDGHLDFADWVEEARKRSVIKTGVSVINSDKILTLVTTCDDFEDARLVVMARMVRLDEETPKVNSKAVPNNEPKYPKKWYSDRNIEYPF